MILRAFKKKKLTVASLVYHAEPNKKLNGNELKQVRHGGALPRGGLLPCDLHF